MKSIEQQLNEAIAKVTAIETENKQLKEAVTEGKKATAKAERGKQLIEAKLPEPCVKRIDEAFSNSTDNSGLKEAINVEAEYIKSVTKVVKNNGADTTTADVDESAKDVEALRERQYNVYRGTGMSKVEASSMSGFKPKK